MVTSTKEIINNARYLALSGKNPDESLNLLINIKDEVQKETEFYKRLYKTSLALAYQEKKDYEKACELYKDAGEKYQAGFCQLLSGNKLEAERLWLSCSASPAVEWGKCLLDCVNLKHRPRTPSYLQIRNFLESDISYFITANKVKYAENVIKYEDLFISVNLETYKLLGRVLLSHGFLNLAKKYLLKSIRVVDQDAETYYYLGLYNYTAGDCQESIKNLNKCLELNAYYVPAEDLLKKINLKLLAN
jgi:tetratricopeptide (TPR) repeat protein